MVNVDPVKRLYRATKTPQLVDVPALMYVCVDGHGEPSTSPAYADAVQALYAISYAVRFAINAASGQSVKVSTLEGLWWASDMTVFLTGRRSEWHWTMMIRQPDVVTDDLVERLRPAVAAKRSSPAVDDLRLVTFTEGPAAQVLHVGPYADEGLTIQRLHAFLLDRGLVLRGKHHEIYLGDPRRAAPDKLRTIIRQPCAPA